MKVTAIIPDHVIAQLKTCTNAATITEALIRAADECIKLSNIRVLNERIRKHPLTMRGFSAKKIRELNRRR